MCCSEMADPLASMSTLFSALLHLDGNPHDNHLEKQVIVALHGGDTDGVLADLWCGGHDPTLTKSEWLAFCGDLIEKKGIEFASTFFTHLEISSTQWDPSLTGTLPGIMMYAPPTVDSRDLPLLSLREAGAPLKSGEVNRIRSLFEAIDSDADGLLAKEELVHAHGGDADGLLKGG